MIALFGLSYYDSLCKSLEIVKRDALHIMDERGEFSAKIQVTCMAREYQILNPETCVQVLTSIEADKKILKEDAKHIIKCNLIEDRDFQLNPVDRIRYEQLNQKYKLAVDKTAERTLYYYSPFFIIFPDLEYKFKKTHYRLCFPFPAELKAYTNFKEKYIVDGIFGLLPAGKSYGGFIKAYLHVKLHQIRNCSANIFDPKNFQELLGTERVFYNSKVVSNEKRLEWFDKLDIKAEDCALWSSIFDQRFPLYKDVHKFFGQIA